MNVAQSFGNGISLYHRDNTTWGKLKLDTDGTIKKDDDTATEMKLNGNFKELIQCP